MRWSSIKKVSDLVFVALLLLSLSSGVLAQSSTSTPTPEATPTGSSTSTPLPATKVPTLSATVQPTTTVEAKSVVTATQLLSESTGIELTVYNQNIALVKDRRQITLTAGLNEVSFTDVAAQIDPTSVHFVSLTDPRGTRVLEQNFEYDLVSTQKLLSKYLDQQISLRTTDGTVYTGVLLSGSDDIILDTDDGIKVVSLARVQEYSFPRLPSGLITRPSLNWMVLAAITGTQEVRVTYLTAGLTWAANYVALLAPDDGAVEFNGWVTLQNESGASYKDAKLKLVAGDINLVQPIAQMAEKGYRTASMDAMNGGVVGRSFFEYHLYEVQRPVTVRQSETKQIEFITAPMVPVTKVFVYEATPRFSGYGYISDQGDYSDPSAKVQVKLQFSNTITNGLGLPLPKGLVRVYKQDSDGGAEFVGEDSIDHTPKNELVSLYLGNAFDLVAERKQVEYRQLSNQSAQETWQVTLRNHKTQVVTVLVIENLFRSMDAEIIASSLGYDKLSANRVRFNLSVKPDSEVVVSYTVLYRW
ncbi:MAG: DUF4139 domain-containing protein [Anaerolineae bacterium]